MKTSYYWLFSCASILLSAVALPADTQKKSRTQVADEFIPAAVERAALKRCTLDAPKLSAAACIDRYWIPIWLLAKHADAQKTDAQSRTRRFFERTHNRVLYEALLSHIKLKTEPVVQENVRNIVEQQLRAELEQPLRIRIAHLYVHDPLKAAELQNKLGPDLSARDFKELCRQFSKDESTYQSGGDLGFVNPNGSTEYPEIVVPSVLYKAAKTLKDGQFSKEPIRVEGGFSLIQRRGSLEPKQITPEELNKLTQERVSIQQQDARQQTLLAQLKKQRLVLNLPLLKKLKLKQASANHQSLKVK